MHPRSFFIGSLLLITTLLGWSQQSLQDTPSVVEEALRTRVTEYYRLFQEAKFRQIEAYVTEESKDVYYAMRKVRPLGASISSVTFSDNIKDARVIVILQMIVPLVSTKPVPMPVSSNWKLVDGEWYAHFPLPKIGDVIDTPFGKKTIKARQGGPAVLGEGLPRPTLKSLAKMFAVDRNRIEFSTSASGPVTETIFIENRSKGRLQIRPLSNAIKGLKIELIPTDISPGEKAILTVVYQPAVRQLRHQYQLRFRVDPIAKPFVVKVDFRN